MEVPGLTPTSPAIALAPVLVTVEAPNTAKVCAAPSGGTDCAQAALPVVNMNITKNRFIADIPVFFFTSSPFQAQEQTSSVVVSNSKRGCQAPAYEWQSSGQSGRRKSLRMDKT
jgi:hypothetical protein